MSEMEMVELFWIIAPTLRAAIKAIYRNSGLCPTSTQRYSSVSPTSWATFYNLEVIIALAFGLDTYEASKIRQKALECICQRKDNDIVVLFVARSSEKKINSFVEQNN